MTLGDGVLFYHSSCPEPGIAGLAEVASAPYPDPTQFDPESKYFDEKSSESDPASHLVDVKFVQKFEKPVTRDELKKDKELKEMMLFKRNRLSITKVTEREYKKILKLAVAEG
jgi:predicted RNA-binding protein with PUA-like domain